MNKKGFTLVELLAVIIIIALLITISSTSILGVMKDIKSNLKESEFNNLTDAGETYISNVIDGADTLYTEVSGGEGSILTGYELLAYVGNCDLTNTANTLYCSQETLSDGTIEYARYIYFDSAILSNYISFDKFNITTKKFTGSDGVERDVTDTTNKCKLKAHIFVTGVVKDTTTYYLLDKIEVEGRTGVTAADCVKS